MKILEIRFAGKVVHEDVQNAIIVKFDNGSKVLLIKVEGPKGPYIHYQTYGEVGEKGMELAHYVESATEGYLNGEQSNGTLTYKQLTVLDSIWRNTPMIFYDRPCETEDEEMEARMELDFSIINHHNWYAYTRPPFKG